MDGLVIFAGAVVAIIALCYFALVAVGAVLQNLSRRYPDTELKGLGRKQVRPGCEFDRDKFLAAKLRRQRMNLVAACQRYNELMACTHPETARHASARVNDDRFYRPANLGLRRAQ